MCDIVYIICVFVRGSGCVIDQILNELVCFRINNSDILSCDSPEQQCPLADLLWLSTAENDEAVAEHELYL